MTQPHELLPCPFCGSTNVEISVYSIEAQCNGCLNSIKFHVPEGTESQTKHAIIRKYNALPRPSPQVAPGLRDFDKWLLTLRTDYLDTGRTVEGETILYILDEYDKRAKIAAAPVAGVEAVKSALDAFDESITRQNMEILGGHYLNLRSAISALASPGPSRDTLRFDTRELRIISNAMSRRLYFNEPDADEILKKKIDAAISGGRDDG